MCDNSEDCFGCADCNSVVLTKGEKGDKGNTGAAGAAGNANVYFASFVNLSLATPYIVKYKLTVAGNYVIMLQGKYSPTVLSDITTELVKNGTTQVANDNFDQRDTCDSPITFTHTAKLTNLIVDDEVGYSISSSDAASVIDNCSLTLIRLT